MPKTKRKNKTEIRAELAELLRINHLQKSGVNLKKVFNGRYAGKDEYRIVVLVGAAASYEAGMESSKRAVVALKKLLKCDEEQFKHDIDKLTTVYRLNEGDFETNLLALSYQKGYRLRDELKELFNCKYFPLQSYEILAHFLKHRFVDAIINFNFDELLDQSIMDEFATGYYHKIITEGDCPEELLTLKGDAQIDVPVYIKPHGTASHPSTMRFTREDYFVVPEDIKTALTNILTKKKTILISVGFGMQSLELNSIIRNQKVITKTFYLNTGYPRWERKKKDREIDHQKELLIKIKRGDEKGISSELSRLWRVIDGAYKIGDSRNLSPRGIERHIAIASTMPKLLSQNFYTNGKLKPFCKVDEIPCQHRKGCDRVDDCEQSEICKHLVISRHHKREKGQYKANYFRGRAVLELIISIAKAKGLVIMSNLKGDRCGQYLEKYHEQLDLDRDTDTVFETGEFPYHGKCTLPQITEYLGFKTVEYGGEIYIHKDIGGIEDGEHKHNQILQKHQFMSWLDSLKPLFCEKNEIFDKRLSIKNFEMFRKHLIKIYEGEEVELTYRRNSPHEKIFQDPLPIRTYTALKWHTHSILEADWDQLYVVAETGEWVMNDSISSIIKDKLALGKSMYILVADETKARITNFPGKNILNHKRTIKKSLPWWIHNKHMTICFKNNGKHQAIYFNRRMKTNYIEAVKLEGKDCETVLDIFYAYWAKATKLCAAERDNDNPCEIKADEVREAERLICTDELVK